MTCKSIEQIPTDPMARIIGNLSLTDIKNLRLTNRWAEKQSFTVFTQLGYRRMVIVANHGPDSPPRHTYSLLHKPAIALPIPGLISIARTSSALARSVRALKIAFGGAVCRECHRERCVHVKQPRNDTTEELGDEESVAGLLKALPKLTELELYGLRSHRLKQELQIQIRISMNAEIPLRPPIASLCLSDTALTSSELTMLIQHWAPSLQKLQLYHVKSIDNDWRCILGNLASAANFPSLVRLLLIDLSVEVPLQFNTAKRSLVLVSPGKTLMKAIRTESGVEVVNIHKGIADMKGKEAIRMGVEWMLEYMSVGDH